VGGTLFLIKMFNKNQSYSRNFVNSCLPQAST
jgi:hypothetical protein